MRTYDSKMRKQELWFENFLDAVVLLNRVMADAQLGGSHPIHLHSTQYIQI